MVLKQIYTYCGSAVQSRLCLLAPSIGCVGNSNNHKVSLCIFYLYWWQGKTPLLDCTSMHLNIQDQIQPGIDKIHEDLQFTQKHEVIPCERCLHMLCCSAFGVSVPLPQPHLTAFPSHQVQQHSILNKHLQRNVCLLHKVTKKQSSYHPLV